MPNFDVAVCGLIVADIIGRPIDLQKPPKRGSLRLLDQIRLFTGGNVCNTGIALAKLGAPSRQRSRFGAASARVAVIGRIGADSLGDFILAELRKNRIDEEKQYLYL